MRAGTRQSARITLVFAASVLGIAVQDTGIGGQRAGLTRIFDRLVTGKPGGLGIGLSISRLIIQAHRGRI